MVFFKKQICPSKFVLVIYQKVLLKDYQLIMKWKALASKTPDFLHGSRCV